MLSLASGVTTTSTGATIWGVKACPPRFSFYGRVTIKQDSRGKMSSRSRGGKVKGCCCCCCSCPPRSNATAPLGEVEPPPLPLFLHYDSASFVAPALSHRMLIRAALAGHVYGRLRPSACIDPECSPGSNRRCVQVMQGGLCTQKQRAPVSNLVENRKNDHESSESWFNNRNKPRENEHEALEQNIAVSYSLQINTLC